MTVPETSVADHRRLSRVGHWINTQWKRVRSRANHPGIRNAAWIGFEKIGRMGLSLFVGIFVIRELGPERYGTYSYVLAWAGIFSPIALFGIGENTIRHLVASRQSEGTVLATSAILRAVSCTVAATLTLAVFWAVGTRADAPPGLVAIALLSLLGYPLLVFDPYFQSHSRARVITVCGLSSGILAAAVKTWGILAGASAAFFLAAYALETVVLGAALCAAYLIITPAPRFWAFDKSLALTLCREALPIILGGFAIVVYVQSDILLLGMLLDSPDEVGIYSAACRLSTMWVFIPYAIITSASPFLYKLMEEADDRYQQRLLQLMSLCVGIAYAFCVPLTLFAQPILALLLGEEFTPAAWPLRAHVWSNIFAILGVAQRSWILSRNLLWVALQNTVLGAAVNLGLNVVFIPAYGATGAAFTTVAATATASVVALALRPSTRRLAALEVRALGLAGLFGGNSVGWTNNDVTEEPAE